MENLLEIFNEKEIKELIEMNHEILDLNNTEITNILNTLQRIGCSKNCIKTNPHVLTRLNIDIKQLNDKLLDIGIENPSILYDNNPFLLNLDSYEIDDFIEKKTKEGLSKKEIIEIIENNSYTINEV